MKALTLANYLAEERQKAEACRRAFDRTALALPPLAGGSPAAVVQAPEGYAAAPGTAPSADIPFDQASHPVTELGPVWSAITLSGESQVLEPKSIKANGFTRFIYIMVETETVGSETAGVGIITSPMRAPRRSAARASSRSRS